jgi:ribosome-associated translation inhibitor RaiA
MEESGFELPKEVEGIDFRVSGIHEEDSMVRDSVYGVIVDATKKMNRLMPVSHVAVTIKRYNEGGSRTKYSVHASVRTEKGEFFAEESEWNLPKAVKLVLEKIEREIYKKEERSKVHAREP